MQYPSWANPCIIEQGEPIFLSVQYHPYILAHKVRSSASSQVKICYRKKKKNIYSRKKLQIERTGLPVSPAFMESNPRMKSKLLAKQGKGGYPSIIPVFSPGIFHYNLSLEATENPSWGWERRRQELCYMFPYPVHEHRCVQAYITPLHTDSRKRGFTVSKRFVLCKCFCNGFSTVQMYSCTFISRL